MDSIRWEKRIPTTGKARIGERLSFRFLKDESRLELAIILDEDTSIDNIRKSWRDIRELRNVLRNIQGTSTDNLENIHKLRYRSMYRAEGYSYDDISLWVNFIALRKMIELHQSIENEHWVGVNHHFNSICDVFRGVQLNGAEIMEAIILGLREMKEGRSPWTLSRGPVSRDKIKEMLRYFDESERQRLREFEGYPGQLQVEGNEELPQVEGHHFGDIEDPITQEAIRLLRKENDFRGVEKLEEAAARFRQMRGY